jgi:hypothetical protein
VNCPWEKIEKFVSLGELQRFFRWVEDQITEGKAEEVPVLTEYQVIQGERWFKHIGSGAIWRLIPADGPLRPGVWPIEKTGHSA